MPTSAEVKRCNEGIQTIIHCFPHILQRNELAKVYSNHGCQTAITILPTLDNINIYPSLEFIPYERITENCIRELDLPRRPILHWRLSTSVHTDKQHILKLKDSLYSLESVDPTRQKSSLKKNSTSSIRLAGKLFSAHYRIQKNMITKATQTTLNVSPHILETDQVATVFTERCTQTTIACTPNESIKSLVPRLEAYLSHGESSSTNTEQLEFEKFPIKTDTDLQESSFFPNTPYVVDKSEKSLVSEIYPKEKYILKPSFLSPSESLEISTSHLATAISESTLTENAAFVPPILNFKDSAIVKSKSDVPKANAKDDNKLRVIHSESNTNQNASVSFSSQKSNCNRKCLCGNRKLNIIANKLRVQASALKLSPQIYPPGVQFEKRVIDVLNTTVATFQTEMAKILEVYVEEDDKTESCLTCNSEKDDDDSHHLKTDDFDSDSSEFPDQEGGNQVKDKLSKGGSRSPEGRAGKECKDGVSKVNDAMSMICKKVDTVQSHQSTAGNAWNFHLLGGSDHGEAYPIVPRQPIGDVFENRHENVIACECHPTAAGAAPHYFASNIPSTSAQQESIISIPETSKTANKSPPYTLTDDLQETSSTVDDDDSLTENTLKFEVLLKNTMQEVKSSSATSTIPVRATISCPNTHKIRRVAVKIKPSLQDLREQVIRLSIIYNTKATGSGSVVEELLLPATVPIQKTSACSHLESFESEFLIRCTSCECSLRSLQSKHSKNRIIVRVPSKQQSSPEICSSCNKLENVHFSSMTCPKHPDKAQCPPGPIKDIPIAPESTKPQPLKKGNIEITVSCHLSVESYPDQTDDEKLSLMYQHEEDFDEPYISQIYDDGTSAGAGVQTDIALGEKLESESLSSIVQDEVPDVCDSKTEIPWQTISLPVPGSYVIKEQEKTVVPERLYETLYPRPVAKPYKEASPVKWSSEKESPKVETPNNQIPAQEDPSVPDEPLSENPTVLNEPPATEEEEAVSNATTNDTIVTADFLEEPNLKSGLDVKVEDSSEIPDAEVSLEEVEVLEAEDGADAQVGEIKEAQPETQEADEEVQEIPKEAQEVAEETQEGGDKKVKEEGSVEIVGEGAEEIGAPVEACASMFSKKSAKLLYEVDHQINEPYMERLLASFPEAEHKDSCTSHTEMPWEDIVLPNVCKIRTTRKPPETPVGQAQVCGCRGPANNNLSDSPDDIVELHVGFEEPNSTLMPISKQVESLEPSEFSDYHEMAKRVPKDYTINISTSKDATSNLIVNIKPSTDCQFPSQKIAVCDDKYTTGRELTASQSSSEITENRPDANPGIDTRGSTSLPQMKANKSVRATISVKRLGMPNQTIIQKKQITPGDNIMTIMIPDEPIKINVKFTSPPLPPKEIPKEDVPEPITEQNQEEEKEKSSEVLFEQGLPEAMEVPPEEVVVKVFDDEIEVKPDGPVDPYKRDPVGSLLKTYEMEMKPLRQALAQLQEKIMSLNIPEIQAFMCPTTIVPEPINRYTPSCKPNTCPVQSNNRAPPRSSFNGPAEKRLSGQYNNFSQRKACGQAAPKATSPNYCPFIAPPPKFSNFSSNYYPKHVRRGSQQNDQTSYSTSAYSNKSKVQKLEHHPFRMQEKPYPPQDLAEQAKHYGMYPDFRGRVYSDERLAYQDYCDRNAANHNDSLETAPSRTVKVRQVISVHSKETMTCRSGGLKRQPKSSIKRCGGSGTNRRRSQRSSQTGPDDEDKYCVATKLRPGQALKTNPDDFLLALPRRKSESVGTCTNSKLKITLPR